MSECKVSVLCTAYNHEQFIRQAIEGVVGQKTDFEFELLINDDVSSDNTAAIIREYAEKFPNIIRPFYQEINLYSQNKDVYYEVFFPNARGKYVAFCEGDDYWTDESKLQRQVDFMESHPEYSACAHDTTLHFCDSSRADELLINSGCDKDVEFHNIVRGPIRAYHTSSLLAKTPLLAAPPDFYYVAADYGFGDYPYSLWLYCNGPIHFFKESMSVYRLDSNPDAWSSGVDRQYGKLKNFVNGKIAMLKAFLPYVNGEERELTEKEILECEFELMYIEGRDKEQRRQPYRSILKRQPRAYRIKNLIKSYLPFVQRAYRKKQGYID